MFIIKFFNLILTFVLVVSFTSTVAAKTQVIPAHAHNDYLHKRPLLDALDAKFKSVEADVFSIDGTLFVAHEAHEIQPDRTLSNLYLDPLKQIIEKNNGSVYGEGSGLILFVDIKNDGLRTYKLLSQLLEPYKAMLTTFHRSGKIIPGAITVIVSGNRPLAYMQNEEVRYAGYDGRLTDLNSEHSAAFMPIISDKWTKHFSWVGEGKMPQDEKDKLIKIVKTAHNKGYQLRFWATPDKPGKARENVWSVLKNAQVDLIGTDDIKGLEGILLSN